MTIESGLEYNRRRYVTGTVARITERHVVVRIGTYVECYRLRDGIRHGGAGRAELVPLGQRLDNDDERWARRIDHAYRERSRHCGDMHRLQALHAAIGEVLEESTAGVR
ncbi:hypothetical protein [Blastococcus tunisiensis]|uniref:hypothetical protein n=1 Tax=Blastococcus tunisiensis TaxID=1798228 RepID=UPI000B88F63B|nr:hypothetical protein [Blastococcus sp. DSM 46838]